MKDLSWNPEQRLWDLLDKEEIIKWDGEGWVITTKLDELKEKAKKLEAVKTLWKKWLKPPPLMLTQEFWDELEKILELPKDDQSIGDSTP